MKKIMPFLLGAGLLAAITFGLLLYLNSQFEVHPESSLYEPYDIGQADPVPHRITPDPSEGFLTAFYNSGYLYHEDTDQGINKDIVEELAKRMNLKLKPLVMPRARISNMLKEGTLMISVSAVETPDRAMYAYYIPYFVQKNDVLIRSDSGITTEEDLLMREDTKVGIIRGYYYGEHYQELIQKLKEKHMIVEAKDTDTLYKMLKDNWIQVTFNVASSYKYYFAIYRIEDINVMDWAPHEAPLLRCVSLSKRYFDDQDVEQFSKVIEEMKMDRTLYQIFLRYLPEDEAKRMSDF